ncbi:hypothetical protein NEUTE1DRAFT_139507 [Neurospora tetrasperma FGSC 2508]|uniref:Uncharacterized protein n=1 Tax=Neurospora tetrasperma (strain FGSC 2508 / ATCC MYA-4615 / P0657) TaxID=510951 RepID=F8MTA7_NEUT8|nr:uncharacterized protein NEUTE1DRAFT_139507 [Neurospora tetrasperma FGSC 2508]EGO55239.1 hypothetical protein NEUTE1DRAFT_139507 [Neurospora tetrasperma FGSC 2508]
MRRAASDDWRDIEERDGGGIFNAERRGDPSDTDDIFAAVKGAAVKRERWEAIAKGEKTFVSVFELERKMLIMPRIVHEPGVSKPTNGRILGKQLFDDECSSSAVLSFPLFLLKILLHYDIADVGWIGIDQSLWPPRTVVDHPHPLFVTPPSPSRLFRISPPLTVAAPFVQIITDFRNPTNVGFYNHVLDTLVSNNRPVPGLIIQGLEGLTHDGRGDSLGTVS